MEELKCPICGEKTRIYMGNARKDRLCGKHADMLKAGKIKKTDDNNYILTDTEETNSFQNTSDDSSNCIICNKSTKGGWKYLCPECYVTCLEYTKEMNKNYTVLEYKDYYYNAKSNIYRLTGFEKFIKPNCIKLIAIAKACYRYTCTPSSSSLLDIVENDIKEIIERKKEKDVIDEKAEHQVIEFNTKKNRGTIRGVDGHFLDSDKEKQIDDLLFSINIAHAIHYNVAEITERTVNADWYIPITQSKGIYIEYFGMDTNDYIQNRDEKVELYKKHKLKLIKIEKDEISDTQRLLYHIKQEIQRLKKEILEEI